MLTRRQFHAGLLAALAASFSRPSIAQTGEPDLARVWLNRLTFGESEAALAEFAALGPEGWLEAELARAENDPTLTDRLSQARLQMSYEAGQDENGNAWPAVDTLRPLSTLGALPADQLFRIDWTKGMDYAERTRPGYEVVAASLIRAVHAPAQLREVMTQFWHDHFNVNAQKDEFCAAFYGSHDASLRQNALGNFRQMLGEVARQPSMLYYLNNADSKASPANENFARELLELHTLGAGNYLNDRYSDWHSVPVQDGVAQGYLDLDVYEVARAFTGWSVGDGRYIDEGVTAPLTGVFHYIESWHDPYQKRVLGVEFAPNRAPLADGEHVLDLLAAHPATATFLCTKIARRLLADAPDPALVQAMAQTFLAAKDAPDQIAQTLRVLVRDPAFSQTAPTKLRRPFELLAALYRATGAEVTGTQNDFSWQLARAGWRQHEYGPPTGHPDVLAKWSGTSSLNRLVDLSLDALQPWFATATVDLAALASPTQSIGEFTQSWASKLGGEASEVLAALSLDPATPAADFTPEDRFATASAAIAFAALTPRFLFR